MPTPISHFSGSSGLWERPVPPVPISAVELMAWACAGASNPGTPWATMRERQAELASKSPSMGCYSLSFVWCSLSPPSPLSPLSRSKMRHMAWRPGPPAPKEWQLARQGSWKREVRAVGGTALCWRVCVLLSENSPVLKDLLGLSSIGNHRRKRGGEAGGE